MVGFPRVGPIEVFTVARIVRKVEMILGKGAAHENPLTPAPSPLMWARGYHCTDF